ncbi:hypothetical protein PICST_28353 [Scheffersomyces stipitis CBS 6054]|uniref:Uncharacterized protein n=1 Tax=Scheffersomyces stipitis (strain ATCC 58785 / CBS 6054 / NBRC 10063 / NRRL Y-11545) TaxID=322104 RepID=A3GFT1_PICST|nr:hypothetical protein PICST_28353 [Scheffersomyces stipitis CBS 6054]EAZ63810.2 hypothetical protein PICST_28353 [Scheffersomyces stipitis CBS 6054]KAG2735237.1 hypothetical protein G9P44_001451 [Scheffersomyces stipitis]
MTVSVWNSEDYPILEPTTLESFKPPDPVNCIPVKRVFDFKSQRLRESLKMPSEMDITSANELVLRVKMVGINFHTDFAQFKQLSPKTNVYSKSRAPTTHRTSAVPGNKIIGRIHRMPEYESTHFDFESKYLVFPYSNCIIQNSHIKCSECQLLLSRSQSQQLCSDNYKIYKRHQCNGNWVYGTTIDGGLQDYMKILNPEQTLVTIPRNVSTHDSCFMLEVALPFYSFIKDTFMTNGSNNIRIPGKILIALKEMSKQVNDILIVLKHFKIKSSDVCIVDEDMISKLTKADLVNYHQMFSQIFLFNCSDNMIRFADFCSSSPGLESTKSRYNIVIFDQNDPESSAKHRRLSSIKDKNFVRFKLSYKDKLNAEELLNIISSMNTLNSMVVPEADLSRPSIVSMDSESSTISSADSLRSNISNSTAASLPQIYSPSGTKSASHHMKSNSSSHRSWLWYDTDFELYHSEDDDSDDFGDDYSRSHSHSIKQMNRLIRSGRPSRIGYTNKASKYVNLNSFVFF